MNNTLEALSKGKPWIILLIFALVLALNSDHSTDTRANNFDHSEVKK